MRDYLVEQEIEIPNANTSLKIVSFIVGAQKEYGALLVPNVNSKLPVRLYVGGFGIDNKVNSVNLLLDTRNDEPFIFAVPALRGQSLSITINGVEYTSSISEGDHCDAFDGAADDVIAFLNVIEASEAKAEVNRTSVRGGSRGATVSLLVAERDKRVKGAVGIAGPVNLLELTSTNENDRTYQCQFLNDLVDRNGSIRSARLKMISSSPVYFAEQLPKTQLHLAQDDRVVPVSQGEDLKEAMNEAGLTKSLELFVYEGKTHNNIADNNEQLTDRINKFLEQL